MLETDFLPLASIVEMNPATPSGIIVALEFVAALFTFRGEYPAMVPSATATATEFRLRLVIDFVSVHFVPQVTDGPYQSQPEHGNKLSRYYP